MNNRKPAAPSPLMMPSHPKPQVARKSKKTNPARSVARPMGLTQRIGSLFPELKALKAL